jgi:hypothetical protein
MYVVKGKHENLLCYDTSVELNIVPIISFGLLPIFLNVFSSRILMLDPVSIKKSTFELLIFTVIFG